MTSLFLHYTAGSMFSGHTYVKPAYVYCLDISSFIDSCLRGRNCAISARTYESDITNYKLAQIEAMENGDISSDDYHARLDLTMWLFYAWEACQNV